MGQLCMWQLIHHTLRYAYTCGTIINHFVHDLYYFYQLFTIIVLVLNLVILFGLLIENQQLVSFAASVRHGPMEVVCNQWLWSPLEKRLDCALLVGNWNSLHILEHFLSNTIRRMLSSTSFSGQKSLMTADFIRLMIQRETVHFH